MTEELLKKQQEEFKERVEELYHLHNKMAERIREFTAQQAELLQRNEQNLKGIQSDISTRLQNEAFRFETARREVAEAMSWNRFRAYGLYVFCAVALAAAIMNMWASYIDVTREVEQLNDVCLNMAIGKVVAIDPKSIKGSKKIFT